MRNMQMITISDRDRDRASMPVSFSLGIAIVLEFVYVPQIFSWNLHTSNRKRHATIDRMTDTDKCDKRKCISVRASGERTVEAGARVISFSSQLRHRNQGQ